MHPPHAALRVLSGIFRSSANAVRNGRHFFWYQTDFFWYQICTLYVLLVYFMYSALYSVVSRRFESILEIQSEYSQSTMYSTRHMRVHAISTEYMAHFEAQSTP